MEIIEQIEALDSSSNSFNINPVHILFEKLDTLIKTQKYKKAAKEIKSIEKDFNATDKTYFLLFDIRMKCIFKQIKHQLSKLFQAKPFETIIFKQRDIERLLNKTEQILTKTTKSAKGIKLSDHSKELFIQNYTEALYLQAKYSNFNRDIPDCVSYLSIAHNVLMNYISKAKEPRTILIYQNILLLLSNVLIVDSDYQTAIEYLKHCLKFCFQEIFIRIDIERGISIEEMPRKDRKNFNKIMRNIIICLFHIGICYENMGFLLQAIEAFKQTRFFSDKFYQSYNPIFGDIVRQTEKRAFQYYDIHLAFLLEKELQKKKEEEEEQLKQSLYEKNYELSKVATGVINDLDRFDELSKRISDYPFKEAKTLTAKTKEAQSEKSRRSPPKTNSYQKNSIFLLTSLRVYNDLLSADYRQFVMENDDLNINCLNKGTNEKLDQFNNKLKVKDTNHGIGIGMGTNTDTTNNNTQPNVIINTPPKTNSTISPNNNAPTLALKTAESLSSIKQTSTNTNTVTNQFSEKRIWLSSHQRIHSQQNINQGAPLNNKKCKTGCMPTIETVKIQIPQTKSEKRIIRKPKIINPETKIIKYKHNNNYIFNKNYQKKIFYLENMNNKEINFQKNLLRILKTDLSRNNLQRSHNNDKYDNGNGNGSGMNLDPIKLDQDAHSLFIRIKQKANDKIKQEKNKFETVTHRKREKATKEEKTTKFKLESKTIMGLDIKYYNQMKNYILAQNMKMKKEYYLKIEDPEVFNQEIKKIPKNNNDILSSLSREIEICDKKAVYLSKR